MESPIRIARETEYYQGYIRFKMSVTNESPYVVSDVTLDFIFDENLLHIADHDDVPVKKEKFVIGNIYGGKSSSFTILFEPLTCAKAADIRCQVTYADHEGRMDSIFMEPKEISVVCPIMKTDSDINIGRLKEFIGELPSKDSRMYEIQSGFDVKKLAHLVREVVEKHDVRHIRTLHTRDGKTCEIWYYGRTKVTKDDIVIRVSILTERHTMELFAATRSAEALTGLLAEVGRDLKQVVEDKASGRGRVVNVHIKDSLVQRSNLLDMCDMDGTCDVNVVIEDSVVQRSSIAAVDEEKSREKAERKKREEEERKRREEEGRLRDLNEKSKKLAREGNSIGMKFTYIPVGEFMMGSEDGDKDEQPVHKVKINKSFYLGTYPVTQREWKAVMDSNPSEFKGDNLPVEMLSWDDAQEFVKKLNAKEGADKYRLPSESEWEYACRAGTTTRYSFGDSESKLGEYAWYADNSGRKPHPVGQKKPNPWGLYDMHGNVWEWVQDNYEFSYGVVHTDESAWEDGSSYRLFRGGGSIEYAWYCRSSSRHIGEADALYIMLGFRLLKEM